MSFFAPLLLRSRFMEKIFNFFHKAASQKQGGEKTHLQGMGCTICALYLIFSGGQNNQLLGLESAFGIDN